MARKKFDWGKLYKPAACLFGILCPVYLTFFLYAWIDSIWPFRNCPGYWAFCVLVQFGLFTAIPFLTFAILAVYFYKKQRFRQVTDVNRLQTVGDPRIIIKWVFIFIGFSILIFFLACLIVLTALVGFYHTNTVPEENEDVLNLSGVQSLNGILLARDTNDVVHISGYSASDVAFGLAFAHAQDRFYQMDLYRRIAMGWLAEIDNSPQAIQSDKFFRTLGLNSSATDNYNLLPSTAQAWLSSYAQGVNAYIGSQLAYPFEFYICKYNGYTRPWSPIHSLAILKMIQFVWSGNSNMELLRSYLLFNKGINFNRISELLPPFPVNGYSTFQPTDLDVPIELVNHNIAVENARIAGEGAIVSALQNFFNVTNVTSPPSTPVATNYASLESLVSLWDASYYAVRDLAALVSNAGSSATFIIQGGVRESPMMATSAADNIKLMAPNLYYTADLLRIAQTSTDTNDEAVGATIPGIPGLFMGRALSYAWTITGSQADTMDWFVMNENANKTIYYTNNGNVSYTVRTEVINVRNGAPIYLNVRVSQFGPIMSDIFQTPIMANGKPLSMALQWTGNYQTSTLPDNTITFLSQAWTAKTTSTVSLSQSFSTMASTLLNVPAANVFYIDRIDNIGVYIGAGRIPLRMAGHTGMYPVKGDNSLQWTGWSTNPVSSVRLILKQIIANAGNRPIGPGYYYNWGYDFADQFRARHLYTLFNQSMFVQSRTLTTPFGLQAMQDQYASIYDDLAQLLTLIQTRSLADSSINDAINQFSTWNGQDPGLTALLETWYWELSRIAETETGIQYWNRPEFILNVFLPNRTNLLNSSDTSGFMPQATINRNIALCTLSLQALYPSASLMSGQDTCTQFAAQALNRALSRVGTGSDWNTLKSTTISHQMFSGTSFDCTSSRYVSRGGSQFTINQGAEQPPSMTSSITDSSTGSAQSVSGPLFRMFIDYQAIGVGDGVNFYYQFCTPMGSSGNLWTKSLYDLYEGAWESDLTYPLQVSGEYSTSVYQYLRYGSN
jgi:penicillin amidase